MESGTSNRASELDWRAASGIGGARSESASVGTEGNGVLALPVPRVPGPGSRR
jgi:hypothetical protein